MRFIYAIRNLVNGKIYVGQAKTLSKRKMGHFYCARNGDPKPLYASIRKYGEENFTFETLEECVDEQVNERERHWVAYFDSCNSQKGYNLTTGGGQDFKPTLETREKIRKARANQVITAEHKLHISEGLLRSSQDPKVTANRRAGQAKRPPCKLETLERRSKSAKEAYAKMESRIKHCSSCGEVGHYRNTCEVSS